MAVKHWLVKQEPSDYSWADFEREGKTAWTGVRNFQARNNLQAMEKGNLVLFYHSGDEKHVVGIAEVCRTAYPDPTAREGNWVCVGLVPLRVLPTPVALAVIKSDRQLEGILLSRQPRLSVMPVTAAHYLRILSLGGSK